MKPSLEDVCSVTMESKPVAEEKEVHEEVSKKEIQPAAPNAVQEDTVGIFETVEHAEHIETETEAEADMTGSVSISFIIPVCCLYILIGFAVIHFHFSLRCVLCAGPFGIC
jgi:hypothetical protein